MCKAIEDLIKDSKAEGTKNERLNAIARLMNLGSDKAFIIKAGYTEEEYSEVEHSMLATAHA